MESAGIRRRMGDGTRSLNDISLEELSSDSASEDPGVPHYTIDQSLPPAKRYEHVATDLKSQASELPAIFDDLVRDWLPNISVNKISNLARLLLRKVYDWEENEELRGISEVVGIEMWLLVALNVLLDMFMGCTSGGVRVEHKSDSSRMLHFRTLDWGMDPLRNIIVHLDFVERAGGEVVASSLGYFGYVGVLTGVRPGLSMSLNFRPNHDKSSRLANVRFYSHIVLVLLGYRPSISSLLRHCLLPYQTSSSVSKIQVQTLESIEQTLPSTTTTAAYLILCDGERTLTIEKDHRTAVIRSANDFIVVTNHDAGEENLPLSRTAAQQGSSRTLQTTRMEDIVDESISRKSTVVKLWEKSLGKTRRSSSKRVPQPRQVLTVEKIVEWMDKYPITNEETHFATIMDPKAGKVVWIQRYLEPAEFDWL